MKFIFLTISFAVLQAVKTHTIPAITHISSDKYSEIGDTVELQCSVKHAESLTVHWMKVQNGDKPLVLSTRKYLRTRNDRFSITELVQNSTSTYILKINNLEASDAGKYSCSLMISEDYQASDNVELHLGFKSPSITSNSSNFVMTSLGESVTLQCYARGFPVPVITWSREDDKPLPYGSRETGNVFTISIMMNTFRGIYYCTANNGIGHAVRHSIKIAVQFSPVITSVSFQFVQEMNHALNLRCEVEAYPQPNITWSKNGHELMSNEDRSLTFFNEAPDVFISSLQITAVEKHQLGDYVCTAVNKLGEAETSIMVFEENSRVINEV